ncbi:MAG: hypothetical protein O3B95_10655, partial [Chloroflexi bacterium]|nr:hypothetical protein [Chloroflexota bacterium]
AFRSDRSLLNPSIDREFFSTLLGPGGIRAGDDIAARNLEQVLGVALLKLNADGTLTCEVFPGQKSTEVNGFTSSAKTYER